MLPRAISNLIFVCLFFLACPASADEVWENDVVTRTAWLMNSHCVSRNSPNTVYVLNAPSSEYMSEIEEKKAVSKLTEALLDNGWFLVTRGEALKYEAYMSENTAAGRQKLQETVARLSNSTITIFFVPVHRTRDLVSADIVFLTRTTDNGEIQFGCAPTITIEFPIPPVEVVLPRNSLEEKAEDFAITYLALWSRPDQDFLSRIMSLYEEPVDFYDETRTIQGIYKEKAAFAKRWPNRDYEFLPNSLSISCNRPYCYVRAEYRWSVNSPSRGEQKGGYSTLTMTLRAEGEAFKIIAEDGDVY